jgi:hypothetical protein
MTPEANTVFSTLLFVALVALHHWTNRRHRAARTFRQGAAATLSNSGGLNPVPVRTLFVVHDARAVHARRGTNPPIPIRLGIHVLPNKNRPTRQSRFSQARY